MPPTLMRRMDLAAKLCAVGFTFSERIFSMRWKATKVHILHQRSLKVIKGGLLLHCPCVCVS